MPQAFNPFVFMLRTAWLVVALSVSAKGWAEDSIGKPSSPKPLQSTEQLAEIVKRIDALAIEMMETKQVTGMGLVIVKDGKPLLEKGYGVRNTQSGGKVSADTVFRLASLSKAFAATATGLLVQDGYIRWDQKVQDLVPGFELKDPRETAKLTIRDLLSHRIGISHNAFDSSLEANQPYPLLAYKLRDVPMICQVGDCYAYQNIAFSLLGDVSFAATGEFYSRLVETRIFHPLGMHNSTFGRDALEGSAEYASPHIRSSRGWVPVRAKETYYRVQPAAGVNASTADMGLWLNAQLGHRPDILSPALLRELHNPQVSTPGERRSAGWRQTRLREAHYAMGWRIYDYSGDRLVFHAGAVQGFRGLVGVLPAHDFGIAILWNCESPLPTALFATTLDQALGLPQHDWLALKRFKKKVN